MSSISKEVTEQIAKGRICAGCHKKLRRVQYGALVRYCGPCKKAGKQPVKTVDKGGRRKQPFWDWFDVDVLQMSPLEMSVEEDV